MQGSGFQTFIYIFAAFAVIVDAKHGAEGFYLKYDFLPFPDEKNRLFLPMKTIESLI